MSVGPIMIMAGGTGGHVFPGLAVADALRSRASAVVWMGTHQGLEARLVPEAGIDIEWISVTGLRGRGLAAWLTAPFRLSFALYQALCALHRRQPVVVLGLGGFVSGPGGVAAWLCRRPLLIHEQNAVAGTTNRLLARIAERVFEAFPGSFPPEVKTELVGNPVRAAIVALPPPRQRLKGRHSRARVLVLGGSQGARVLNQMLPAALRRLPAELRPEVWHQAGRGVGEAEAAYRQAAVEAKLESFVEDMARAYAWADLVVCRAGALTVSELAAAGVGAVLIPYPHAIDDHQTKNAEHFVAAGAGVAIPQSELDAERLAAELERLLNDRERLRQLAESARRQARVDAAERIAAACLELAGARP